ncbi:MAG: DOMON-like domain-containing protein [Calothrix sp. C42_A2020_038]|nr:DOMON-like domain-containing protein [Calothrix sp. C42_A2020_038]
MQNNFSLQPFTNTQAPANLKITGNIARNGNLLIISYALLGDIQQVDIAPSAETPARKHELWQDTCFEFFLGAKNSPRYWEFNLSPTGHWNIYRFDNYRQGMQEETTVTTLPFSVQHNSDSLALTLNFDLAKIISVDQSIEVAITTVIKSTNNEVSYWALTHKGAEPDFHLRESFIIDL